MKIFFYSLREYDEKDYVEKFSKDFNIDYEYTTQFLSIDNIDLAKGCDGISITPCTITDEMWDKLKENGIRYISTRSIGYEHLDISKAKERNIHIGNSSYSGSGVADYTIMLMLMSLRKMNDIMKRSEVQDFTLNGKMGSDLSSCTVGVIGTGNIGFTLIKHLSGFGCKIIAYDPYKNSNVEQFARYVSLDELYEQSDIITLHTNATEQNYHLINKEAFAKMKDGVIIINTSRGTLIDTKAIIDAIESGKVGRAALDVLEDENGLYYFNHTGKIIKNRDMAVLKSFPNVIVTPHTAFYTDDAIKSMILNSFELVDMLEKNKPCPREIKG